MGIIHGNLTHGELFQVLGRTLVDIGERSDAGDFEDGIQIGEMLQIIQRMATDLYGEYTDTEKPE
jgi:hypothetical protein